jgi:hypothetical protein
MANEPQRTTQRSRNQNRKSHWLRAELEIATEGGLRSVRGYIHLGLGLHRRKGTKVYQGHREPIWTLTHLNTGHMVCEIIGSFSQCRAIATVLAECSCWNDIAGLKGWTNIDPDLPTKVRQIISENKRCARYSGTVCEESAREIYVNRIGPRLRRSEQPYSEHLSALRGDQQLTGGSPAEIHVVRPGAFLSPPPAYPDTLARSRSRAREGIWRNSAATITRRKQARSR